MLPYDNIKYGLLYNWYAMQEQGSSYYPANAEVWDGTNSTMIINILGEINNEIPFNVYSGEIELTLNEMAESYAELGEYEYMIYTQDGGFHFIIVKTSEGELINTKPNGYITLNRLAGHSIIADAMASEGWGVPSGEDYGIMLDYYLYYNGDDFHTFGGALKEVGLIYWNAPNTGATNFYDMNVRGGGRRDELGQFIGKLEDMLLGVADELNVTTTTTFFGKLTYDSGESQNEEVTKNVGSYIRPVRPATTAEQLLSDGELTGVYYYGNDGKVYRTTKIGTQVWVADNLAETKWSDGSWIQGYDGGVYTPISDVNWVALTTAALCAYGDDISNI